MKAQLLHGSGHPSLLFVGSPESSTGLSRGWCSWDTYWFQRWLLITELFSYAVSTLPYLCSCTEGRLSACSTMWTSGHVGKATHMLPVIFQSWRLQQIFKSWLKRWGLTMTHWRPNQLESRWQDSLPKLGYKVMVTILHDYLDLEIHRKGNSGKSNWLSLSLITVFKCFYFAFPHIRMGPHTVCEWTVDHLMNQGFLKSLARQEVSRTSHQEPLSFSPLAALQERQRGLHFPGSVNSRASHTQCPDGSAVLQNLTLLLAVQAIRTLGPPPHTHIQAQLVESQSSIHTAATH